MPCSSEHMEPTFEEKRNQQACAGIVYLSGKLRQLPPDWAVEGAKSIYGDRRVTRDRPAQLLCDLCEEAGDDVVYGDVRVKEARNLAEWWDYHKEQDAKRAKEEEGVAEDDLRCEIERLIDQLPKIDVAKLLADLKETNKLKESK